MKPRALLFARTGGTLLATVVLSLGAFLACQDRVSASPPSVPVAPPTEAPPPPANPPATSLEFSTEPLSVSNDLKAAPLDVSRQLKIPAGFKISVLARVSKARFMARAPNGDLLVSQPSGGKVLLLRPKAGGGVEQFDFVTALNSPHDIVFDTVDGQTWVYLSEVNQISRFKYASGSTQAGAREVVVSNLPSKSTPELRGQYGHELKNIAIDGNHKLYVSIASTCNICKTDTESDPVRGAIYVYDADGKNGRLFARGLRNAEGLSFVPGTNDLWVVVNNRDNALYPYHKDFDGDSKDDYGKLLQSFVDNYPPEPFTKVRDGGNYGWPFCNPNPSAGVDNMPFDNDVEMNPDGTITDCGKLDRVSKGIQAHSAPLGVSFIKTARLEGAVSGLHGSWNRAVKTGYKVIYFPFSAGKPGAQVDLVSGWIDANGGNLWGRPVDAIGDGTQGLYISDDYAGAVYHLEPK